MKRILVLMSTYNGEKYLDEQIKSIKNQKNVDVDLLIRDDNSIDKSIDIIKKNNINYYFGENLKSAYSFMDLIFNCDDKYDYYALSDQDDYWLNNKLYEAIKLIENKKKNNQKKPIMYFSSKDIVDKNLNLLYKDVSNEEVTLSSAFIKNIATGCTIVFNNEMLKMLRKYRPYGIEMHDSWMYRLCLAVGGIAIKDNNSYILYRQHGNNVIGANEKIKNKIKRRLKSLLRPKRYRSQMAKELLCGYSDYISNDSKIILELFSKYLANKKIKKNLLFSKKIRTKKKSDNFIFKISVLLNLV